MIKMTQAFLTGIFFTFILDFFLFLGIKINYIDHYDIDLYYNILFADNQNFFLYLLCSILIGYLVIYINNNKLSAIVLSLLFLLSLSSLVHPVGHKLAQTLLMQKNQTLQDNRYTYQGDIYYDGRESITFFDYELQRMITLQKERLK